MTEHSSQKNLDTYLASLRNFIEDNESVKSYLLKTSQWSDMQLTHAKQSEKMAWRMTYITGIFAFLVLLALIGLTPFKTVAPPLVFKMDKSTGQIEALQTVNGVQNTVEEVFTKKFINDFMLAREHYTYDTARLNYHTAAAFMSPALESQWADFWNTGNPQSPLNVYKNDTQVGVQIASIILNDNTEGKRGIATVHFSRDVEKGGNHRLSHWVATLTYRYVQAPTEESILRINPLGFQVIDYRIDPEIGGDHLTNAPENTHHTVSSQSGGMTASMTTGKGAQ